MAANIFYANLAVQMMGDHLYIGGLRVSFADTRKLLNEYNRDGYRIRAENECFLQWIVRIAAEDTDIKLALSALE